MQVAHFVPEPVDASAQSIAHSLSDLYSLVPTLEQRSGSRAIDELKDHLSRYAEDAAQLGLVGLQNVQARLIERVLPFAAVESLPIDVATALEEWLQINFNYLAAPGDEERWPALIDFLSRPIWNDPLSTGQGAIIHRLFELSAQEHSSSLLSAPDSEPIIDDRAAAVISASLAAISSGDDHAILDVPEFPREVTAESPEKTSEPADVPSAVAELVALIREELRSDEEALDTQLQNAAMAALAGASPSLEEYRWQLERLANASEAVGLKGLHELLARILDSTHGVEKAALEDVASRCETLAKWPALVAHYLDRLADVDASRALVDYAAALDGSLPLDDETAHGLLEKLSHPEFESSAMEVKQRVETATAEMASLEVPADIHSELLESMLHELPAQTQSFSQALQRIVANGTLEDVRTAQRVAHTLKGSANTVGIRGLAELSHHLEDIFLALEQREMLPPNKLSRTLIDAGDCIEAMSEALIGVGPAPSQILEVLQDVIDWANRIDREGLEPDVEVTPEVTALQPALRIEMHDTQASMPSADAPVEVLEATERAHQPRPEMQTVSPALRVATAHVDDLLRLSGESKIVGSQLKEGLRRVESQLGAVRRQNQLLQQLVNELEQLVDVRGISMPTVNRADSEFDALEMDQYSELHTVSRRLAEVAMDSREWSAAAQGELDSLDDLLLSQARHSNETQESILKMRMVPATTIVGRLQRAVRQTCRLLDKDVELTVKGADTLIDGDSLNQIVDPLMHLMRNAIDHGIESRDDRLAVGKQPQGRLTVEFAREGTQIAVRCIDDGRGLDYDAIRSTAEVRGFVATNAVLTEAQLGRLIFEPGFSTATEVTQISGRGIGLDIVHARVSELKGTFDVQSQRGLGCRFLIRLPATLISAHALLVKHGKHTVAVASRGVRQILDAQAGTLASVGGQLTLQVGGDVYEAFQLETLLGRSVDRRDLQRGTRPALLIEVNAERVCAILVQSVIDTIDLVVKPLGPFVPKSVGLIGATILGDGGVAPVMDLPDLLRSGKQDRAHTDGFAPDRAERAPNRPRLPSVLVVDDSLSVRRAMEQLLRDSGYEVRLARDGLEAVAILEAKTPDLMLVDLEMPRMNGMELTAHVRNREPTRSLPIIMITSRSTDKHRKQAEAAGVNHYMTKPYAEDLLLERLDTLLRHSA